MQTDSKSLGPTILRIMAVAFSIGFVCVAIPPLLEGRALAAATSAADPALDERLSCLLLLNAWRNDRAVSEAIQRSQEVDSLPVTLPRLPSHPLLAGPGALRELDRDQPWVARGFLDNTLADEWSRCLRIVRYLDQRNQIVAERDALLATHSARIGRIAMEYPVIRHGITQWIYAFERDLRALRSELGRLTITTTTSGSRGGILGRTTNTGLVHWAGELEAIESAMQRAQSSLEPYASMLAAESAVSLLAVLRAEIASIPTSAGP
jgi:hypothetical protein